MIAVDVAVVGAGPAGSTAALTLARRGHSVAVCSRQSAIRRPIETAGPRLRTLLQGIGAEDVLVGSATPCRGIEATWATATPTFRPAIADPHGPALFLRRDAFDSRLQKSAGRAATVWLDRPIDNCSEESNCVELYAGKERIRAQWLIDASGSASGFRLQIARTFHELDRLTVFWTSAPKNVAEAVLKVEAVDDGWWYFCPSGKRVDLCFVTDSMIARKERLHIKARWLAMFRRTRFAQSFAVAEDGEVQVSSFGIGYSSPLSGRTVAVGDATLRLDPLGSSGLITAVESGQRAAAAVSDVLRGEREPLRAYEAWATGLLRVFQEERLRHYQMAFPRGTFWDRRAAGRPPRDVRVGVPAAGSLGNHRSSG